jgi:hypothetical protein
MNNIDDPRYHISQMDEYLEREMQRHRKCALKSISYVMQVKPTESNESFILMFVYAWQENLPAAINLAEQVNLCKLDFLALAEDFDGFKETYLKESEKDMSYYEIQA